MLKLKTVVHSPYARDPGELFFAEKMDKFCLKLQFGHLPVFRLTYHCYAVTYNLLQFLRYGRISGQPSSIRPRIGRIR